MLFAVFLAFFPGLEGYKKKKTNYLRCNCFFRYKPGKSVNILNSELN